MVTATTRKETASLESCVTVGLVAMTAGILAQSVKDVDW